MFDKYVSVIIPTYNRINVLARAVNSVLNQTYENFELIIVDDGSNDGTEKYLQSISDPRVKYIKGEHKGAGAARNTGVKAAKYDIIAFCDSDSIWHADKLEKQLSTMEDHPKSKMIYCCYKSLNNDGTENGIMPSDKIPENECSGFELRKHLVAHNMVGTPTMMINKDVFERVNGFDEELPALEDYDLVLRISEFAEVTCCHEILVDDYVSSGSVSSNLMGYFVVKTMIIARYKDELKKYALYDPVVYLLMKKAEKNGIRQQVSEMLDRNIYYAEIKENIDVSDGILNCSDYPIRDDIVYVLCPYGIENTFYISGFMKALKDKYSDRKFVMIIKEDSKEVLSWFEGSSNLDFILSDELVRKLNYFAVTEGIFSLGNFLYGYFKKDRNFTIYPKEDEEEGISKIDRYARFVLDLDDKDKFEIPDFYKFNNCAEITVAEGGVTDKNTIILVPYSESEKLLPEGFWEILAQTLSNIGFKAVTIGIKEEKVIPGIKRILLPLTETVKICEKARCVISLRSGLCDILSFADTKLFIIYTSEIELKENKVESFGINNLLCDSPKKMAEVAGEIIENVLA